MEKIYITGTGRCGTTFLIKLFTFLGFDTGFTRNNYSKFIFKNCNSGMEKPYNAANYVIKNPTIFNDISKIAIDTKIYIKCIILPIRDFEASATSRNNLGYNKGGLWRAKNVEEQIVFYQNMMVNYIQVMTKYSIPTIFLDFNKMVSDKAYLYDMLKPIMDEKNITIEIFAEVYDEVTISSAPASTDTPL